MVDDLIKTSKAERLPYKRVKQGLTTAKEIIGQLNLSQSKSPLDDDSYRSLLKQRREREDKLPKNTKTMLISDLKPQTATHGFRKVQTPEEIVKDEHAYFNEVKPGSFYWKEDWERSVDREVKNLGEEEEIVLENHNSKDLIQKEIENMRLKKENDELRQKIKDMEIKHATEL